MNTLITTAAIAAFASTAFAQFDPSDSVAAFSITPSDMVVNIGETVRFEVRANAVQNQIGNNTGIGGVNVDTTVVGGQIDLASIMGNDEDVAPFNLTSFGPDTFGTSQSRNVFVGDNYTEGTVLYSFDVLATELGVIEVSQAQGTVSLFTALVGFVGPFQPSVPYDVVLFDSATVNVVPTPSALACLGVVSLAAARRRR